MSSSETKGTDKTKSYAGALGSEASEADSGRPIQLEVCIEPTRGYFLDYQLNLVLSAGISVTDN